jgi:hypothetical protein
MVDPVRDPAFAQDVPPLADAIGGVAGLPVADDRFWNGVAERLHRAGAELALLESWSAATSRWHLVSAGTRLETVRALLKPGALLTLYPDPPRALDDTLATRAHELLAAAGSQPENEILGLIQEPETHMLRFLRLRTAEDLAAWLSRAQSGLICGLYPSKPVGPDTLQAVVPQVDVMQASQAQVATDDAPSGPPLWRIALGLLVLLAVVVVCAVAGREQLSSHDYRPPRLDDLQARAGCTDRDNDPAVGDAVESGSCQVNGTAVMLATFRNDSDRSNWITSLRLMGAQNFGVGPGWAIEADDAGTAAQVAAALGGHVVLVPPLDSWR